MRFCSFQLSTLCTFDMRLCKELTKICKQHQATIAFPSKSHLGIACVSHSAGPAQPQPTLGLLPKGLCNRNTAGERSESNWVPKGEAYILVIQCDPLPRHAPHCPAIIRPNLHQSSNKPSKPGTTISYPFSLTHPEPLILAPVACRTGCWGGPRPMPRMMRPGHHFCCGKLGCLFTILGFHHSNGQTLRALFFQVAQGVAYRSPRSFTVKIGLVKLFDMSILFNIVQSLTF